MWYTRWQCQFQSFGGTNFAVNICTKQQPGSVQQLTGAAEPFTTQEDDSDDIFTPIRSQTGYLRVIDPDGSLLADLIPANNTERLVQLWSGTNTGASFTPQALHWQGFLQAQAYTQPWDGNVSMVELPVKSLLGALEDVHLNPSIANSETRIARMICNAFNAIDVYPSNVGWVSDIYDVVGDVFLPFLQNRSFFNEEEVLNEGDTTLELRGCSYSEALSKILSLYGLTMREDGQTLWLASYDKAGGRLYSYSIEWSIFDEYIANGSYLGYSPTEVSDTDLLPALNWRGDDNVVTFLQGGKEVVVSLSISDNRFAIELPATTESSEQPIEVQNIYTGHVFVQPHTPRVNSFETFTFSEYQQVGQSGSQRVGSSTYQNCLNNSVIYRPLYDPHYSSNDNLHTGAFPCRWFYQKEDAENPQLRNGLFLNQQYLSGNQSFTPGYCYSISSKSEHQHSDGALRIDMVCHNFMRGRLAGDSDKLYFGEFTTIWGVKPETILYCILTWGNQEWNGQEWVTHSGNYQTFQITFDGNGIKTNKTPSIHVDENQGYFVPITAEMKGKIKFYIVNVASTTTDAGYHDAHSRIIEGLIIERLYPVSMVSSRRNENVYRQIILQSGFSETLSISLGLGTMNNNVPSNVFIKTDANTYKESANYYTSTSTKQQRPEHHLIDRMAAIYRQVRRAYSVTVERGLELMQTRYIYIGRQFFGVKTQTNWRDDIEEVKFIEVT